MSKALLFLLIFFMIFADVKGNIGMFAYVVVVGILVTSIVYLVVTGN